MFALVVEDSTIGFLDGTDILKIKPDWRGMGYGKLLAEFMLQREFDAGRTVVTIGIAPYSAEPFWRVAMGFTVLPDRTWCGGGTFAYKVLTGAFPLGADPRVPYSVKFYTEEQAMRRTGFRSLASRASANAWPMVRSSCPNARIASTRMSSSTRDYFVAIEVDGLTLVLDQAKREKCARLGVQKDKSGIFFVDAIIPLG